MTERKDELGLLILIGMVLWAMSRRPEAPRPPEAKREKPGGKILSVAVK